MKGLHFTFLLLFAILLGCSSKPQRNTLSDSHSQVTHKADSFFHSRVFDSAYYYNRKVLDFLSPNDSQQIARRFNLLARCQQQFNKNDSVLYYLNQARDYMSDASANQVLYWNTLAGVQFFINKDTALAYFEKAQKYNLSLKERLPDELARTYGNIAFLNTGKYKFDEAISLYQQALEIYENEGEVHSDVRVQLCSKLADLFSYKQQYHLALAYREKAYQLIKVNGFPDSSFIPEYIIKYAYANQKIGRNEKSIPLFLEAAEICNTLHDTQRLLGAYLPLAFAYASKGEEERFWEYIQKSEREFHTLDTTAVTKFNAYTWQSLALAYEEKEIFDKAIGFLIRAIGIYEQIYPKDHPFLHNLYLNAGAIYTEDKKYAQANAFLQKAFAHTSPNDPYRIDKYQRLGDLEKNFDHPKKALKQYQKAIDISLRDNQEKAERTGEIYHSIATVYKETGDHDRALSAVQKSIASLLPGFQPTSDRESPSLVDPLAPTQLLASLTEKGQYLREGFQQSKNLDDLHLALETFELAQQLVDTIRLDYEASEAKLSLMGDLAPLYEKSVAVAANLYTETKNPAFLEKAFSFAERSRAMVLYESLQDKKASQISEVPQDILDKLNGLHLDISFFKKAALSAESPAIRDSLNERVFALKGDYFQLKKEIEKAYPNYYRFKYNLDLTKVDKIQAFLREQEANMIEYLVGDSTLYVFCLNGKDIRLESFVIDSTFDKEVIYFRELISQPDKEPGKLASTGEKLFEQLIQPVMETLTGKRLIIIPDGRLSLIPFEALPSKALIPFGGDYRNFPFLFQSYSISYAYSSSLLLQKFGERKSKHSTLAFAPSFEGLGQPDARSSSARQARSGIGNLKHTRAEAQEISELTDGKVFSGKLATESTFKQIAGDYKVIHLATHGLVDDDHPLYSQLIMAGGDPQNDGYLHTYEIFGLKLNADLVVLSACNTGFGKLERGEGVMSLARGFAQAGVPSIVMSLWPVDDEASSRLMVFFYQELKNGLPKDEALSAARQKYLSTCKRYEAHPYFWAGFVALGDMSPVEFSSSWW